MQAIMSESELNSLCQALLKADTDIQDIILFSSFANSPSIARDIDLLITTKKKKSLDSYYSLKTYI